jgi:hypothetical protein
MTHDACVRGRDPTSWTLQDARDSHTPHYCTLHQCRKIMIGGFPDEDDSRVRTKRFAWAAGVLFSVGWWTLIGATVDKTHGSEIRGEYYLPSLFQCCSFLMINLISWEAMDENNADMFDGGRNTVCVNRGILVGGLLIQLTCLLMAVFTMVTDFAVPENGKNPGTGLAIVLSNAFLFLSTWLMRWGTISSDNE